MLMEFTTALPCTQRRPASITLHLELSIMMGTREISGSDAIRFRKRTMAAWLSSMASSMLMSMICAPFSTCWRATASASSNWPFRIMRAKALEPVTLVRSPTLTNRLLLSMVMGSRPESSMGATVLIAACAAFTEVWGIKDSNFWQGGLHRNPGAGALGGKQRVDDAHVLDGVFHAVVQWLLAADGQRKSITLQAVLVAGGEGFGEGGGTTRHLAIVHKNACLLALGRVEGDFDLHPLLGANRMHPLVGRGLHGHGEIQTTATPKVQQGAEGTVHTKLRIHVRQRHHPHRLGTKQEPPRHNRVAADVHQGAATFAGVVADVGGIAVEVREPHLHGAQIAQRTALHQLAGAQPLRVEAHHESFHDVHLVGYLAQLCGLVGVQRNGLFAQHMFARARCRQRHGHMLVVGQRVDRKST